MGLLDKFKKKAEDLAEGHGDQIKKGLEKAANLVDSKTKGKHSDKIDQGVDKAKDLVDKLAEEDDKPDAKGDQPPAS